MKKIVELLLSIDSIDVNDMSVSTKINYLYNFNQMIKYNSNTNF